MPEGFEEVFFYFIIHRSILIFPTAARELSEHNHMGDFIQLIARVNTDDTVLQQYHATVLTQINRRGVLQYCSYCGGLYLLTTENLRFLTIIVDALIRTVIQLSESEGKRYRSLWNAKIRLCYSSFFALKA
ncbi:Tat pathway signal sequence domain protein [Oesophagostomum dentatum]|uniref:Tat pathway signal sequence domain protein n=1 Tax=Oesophagostomum dentatum TaxID=61180 RepID=A0A0B1SET3_OESDE|nr:Tat pathway signal sequence domain protein [Oesophagostomum dentatum]